MAGGITVTGLKNLKKQLSTCSVNADRAIKDGVKATAFEVRNTAIKSIQELSKGELVQRQRQSGRGTYEHQASRVGDPPNTDTGTLVRSIAAEQDKTDEFSYVVGSSLDYASFLEFGTSKMEARPWLEPALDANKSNLSKNIIKAIKRQTRVR